MARTGNLSMTIGAVDKATGTIVATGNAVGSFVKHLNTASKSAGHFTLRWNAALALMKKGSAVAASVFRSTIGKALENRGPMDDMVMQWRDFERAISSVSVELGNAFLPALVSIANAFRPIVEQVRAWVAANRELAASDFLANIEAAARAGLLLYKALHLANVAMKGGAMVGALWFGNTAMVMRLDREIRTASEGVEKLDAAFEKAFSVARTKLRESIDDWKTWRMQWWEATVVFWERNAAVIEAAQKKAADAKAKAHAAWLKAEAEKKRVAEEAERRRLEIARTSLERQAAQVDMERVLGEIQAKRRREVLENDQRILDIQREMQEKAAVKAKAEEDKQRQAAENNARGIMSTFQGAFDGIISGTKSVGDAFETLFERIASNLIASGILTLLSLMLGPVTGPGGAVLSAAVTGPTNLLPAVQGAGTITGTPSALSSTPSGGAPAGGGSTNIMMFADSDAELQRIQARVWNRQNARLARNKGL